MRQKRDFCYFCEDSFHRSVECKKYRTEKSRKSIAKKKKRCYMCFIESSKIYLPESKECPTNETCLGWYSTEHHRVFCPARIEELRKTDNIFFPKIDETLFSRFADTLEMDEKYVLGTSSTMAQKHIKLNNIKVIEGLGGRYYNLDVSDSSTFVVTMNFYLPIHDVDHVKKFSAKQIICKSRIVTLYDIKMPADDILPIFSPITRNISLLKINCAITFSDIMERVPNIEIFEMKDNSLKVNGKTWLKDLMKYKSGKNFQKLDIHLDTVEFDIEFFKEFLTTKSARNVFITIMYDLSLPKEEINNFIEKVGKYFDEEQLPTSRYKPHINLVGDGIGKYFTFDIENFVGPSTSKATRKRKHQ